METYIQSIIKYAIDFAPTDEDNYAEWRELEFNTTLKDVPDYFDLDWIYVLNYIAKNELEQFGDADIKFPLDKKVLYNKFNYMILYVNESLIFVKKGMV